MTQKKRYSQKEQQSWMETYQRSGLSKLKFCQQANIPYTTFKNWFWRNKNKLNVPKELASTNLEFCQLNPIANKAPPPGMSVIRVRLPNDCLIEIPVDSSALSLRVVLSALGVSHDSI